MYLNINLCFIEQVEPLPFAHNVPVFPAPRANNLQFPNTESKEVHARPAYIPEYLPLMFPERHGELF